MFILFPTAPKVLTHSNINSKSEFKVSSKYHLKQIWMRLKVQFILRFSSCKPVKLNKLCASKIQWQNRHRTDIYKKGVTSLKQV